jgi:hypothetical protein
MEEIQKLRSINKDRDHILEEFESRGKSMRETDTKLKMTMNDVQMLTVQKQNCEGKIKDL